VLLPDGNGYAVRRGRPGLAVVRTVPENGVHVSRGIPVGTTGLVPARGVGAAGDDPATLAPSDRAAIFPAGRGAAAAGSMRAQKTL
jgi:hypothetical protein